MENKEKFEAELKQGLLELYDQLLNCQSEIEARSCFFQYKIVLKQYDEHKKQQFNLEVLEIENKIGIDTIIAVKNMKDDVETMYKWVFKEYIPSPVN